MGAARQSRAGCGLSACLSACLPTCLPTCLHDPTTDGRASSSGKPATTSGMAELLSTYVRRLGLARPKGARCSATDMQRRPNVSPVAAVADAREKGWRDAGRRRTTEVFAGRSALNMVRSAVRSPRHPRTSCSLRRMAQPSSSLIYPRRACSFPQLLPQPPIFSLFLRLCPSFEALVARSCSPLSPAHYHFIAFSQLKRRPGVVPASYCHLVINPSTRTELCSIASSLADPITISKGTQGSTQTLLSALIL